MTFFLIYIMTHTGYLRDLKQLTVSLLCFASEEIFSDLISGIRMTYDTVPMVDRMVVGQAGMPAPAGGLGGSYLEDASPIETVRTFFPETWIWDLVEVG